MGHVRKITLAGFIALVAGTTVACSDGGRNHDRWYGGNDDYGRRYSWNDRNWNDRSDRRKEHQYDRKQDNGRRVDAERYNDRLCDNGIRGDAPADC